MTASTDTKAAQVGGTHYSDTAARCPHCDGEIQHWDLYSNAPGLVYSATKHITRHRQKGGKQDLLKAITEIQKIIEQEYPDNSRVPANNQSKRFDHRDIEAIRASELILEIDYVLILRRDTLMGTPLPEEIMRDEWAGTRGGAAHTESAHPDLLPLDNSPEAVLARANAFASHRPNDDVPTGWVLELTVSQKTWHFRSDKGSKGWSEEYATRSSALDALIITAIAANR